MKAAASQASYPRGDGQKLSFGRSLETRQKLFDEALRLTEEGMPGQTVSVKLGLPRSTLARWLAQGTHSLKRRHYLVLEPYLPYLHQRWQAGFTNRKQLFRELVSQGFQGSYGTIYNYTNALIGKALGSEHVPQANKTKRHILFDTLKLFGKKPELLNEEEAELLAQLNSKVPEAKSCYDLVQQFHQLVRQLDKQSSLALTTWLSSVKQSAIMELQRFANGLEQDRAAVEAALSLPWSNGQTEGQITKLKLLKRQMYGRAKFDLLRRRVLLY